MKKEPIVSFKDKNGSIELFDDIVKLETSFGVKRIPLTNVLSMKIKAPGTTDGFLHFSVIDSPSSKKWTLGSEADEYTIYFTEESEYRKAVDIKDRVRKVCGC